MDRVKITGQRGSWFAKVDGKQLPIMWADELRKRGEKNILRTDWLETAAQEFTKKKRDSIVEYFKNSIGDDVDIIVARAKDTAARPREIEKYIAVYSAKVLSICPEIELEILERKANAKY